MDLTFLGICDLASVTREGKVNLIGIFRQIFVQKIPTNYLKFTIVAMVTGKENSQQPVTIQILDPLKKQVINQQLNMQIGPGGMANLFFDVVNLPLRQTGDYRIELQADNKTLGHATFNVLRVQPQSPSGKVN